MIAAPAPLILAGVGSHHPFPRRDARRQAYMDSRSSNPLSSARPAGVKSGKSVRLIVRWIGRIALSLVGLLVLSAATVYGISERRFRTRLTSIPEHPLTVSEDVASVGVVSTSPPSAGAWSATAQVSRGTRFSINQ